MKKTVALLTFVIVFLMLATQGFGQRRGVYADPSITKLSFTNAQNKPVSVESFEVGNIVNCSFSIGNKESDNAIPMGTCRVKFTLGMLCFMVTDLKSSDAPLNEYFSWTASSDPFNQTIIAGELIKDLPAGFEGKALFSIMPAKAGNSALTAQFLISNHNNPKFILSDVKPYNNNLSETYVVKEALGTKFIAFKAVANACDIDLNWQVNDEQKISGYIVETSADGINFKAAKTIEKSGTGLYNSRLENFATGNVKLRVKAEARQTGQTVYSEPVDIKVLCNGKLQLVLYPNPLASDATEVSIVARIGKFDGKYRIRLLDLSGKEINKKEIQVASSLQIKYYIGLIPVGSYNLNVTNEDGQSFVLPFVK